MRTTLRQNEILNQTRLDGSCSIINLAEQLKVSEETIRRDIKPLVEEGLVEKVHGGIVLPNRWMEPPIQRRLLKYKLEKQAIAKAVAGLIGNGDSLIMDTGSTTTYVAQALNQHIGLTLITNSAQIGMLMSGNSRNRIMLTGGELRADDGATFGSQTLEFLRLFQARYAVLSVGAVHADKGMMVYHLCEADYSKTAIAQAEQVIVVADHSKFDCISMAAICPFAGVDILVTDREPSRRLLRALELADVRIVIAEI